MDAFKKFTLSIGETISFFTLKNMSDSKEFAVPALPAQKQQQAEVPAPTPTPAQENTKRLPQPPPLKYEKPSWSAQPTYKYRLEVLKNGASLETVQGPRKEFVTIGRLPICDIPMEHPVSCHCVLVSALYVLTLYD